MLLPCIVHNESTSARLLAWSVIGMYRCTYDSIMFSFDNTWSYIAAINIWPINEELVNNFATVRRRVAQLEETIVITQQETHLSVSYCASHW